MNQTKLSPANIVILAAGVVMLVGSFLTFYSYSLHGFGSYSASAWGGANGFGVFGIATVVVLCGVVMAAQVGLSAFASGVKLPERLLGLSWDQVHLALGFQATLMMIAFLIRDKGPFSFGIGFWFMLLSGIALLVGAIMRVTGAGAKSRGNLLQARDDLGHQLARRGRVGRDPHAGVLEHGHLRLRGALRARDDRAGVAHLLAGRCGDPRDVAHDGLRHAAS